MPTVGELIVENGVLRKKIAEQQMLISTQRETLRVVRKTKVALVAGQYADTVDVNAEKEKAADANADAGNYFQLAMKALQFYGKASKYADGSIAADGGSKARDVMSKLDQQA